MKLFWLGTLLLFSFTAQAGDKVLNGGNLIVCPAKAHAPEEYEMLDIYEAKLRGKNPKFSGVVLSWSEKVYDLLKEWEEVAPKRVEMYLGWLASFESEAEFHSGIEIPAIPDYGSVAIPAGCRLEPVAFQRSERDLLPGVSRYVVNKDLWDRMDEEDRAALVLHELVYREAIKMNHANSFPTRYLTGFFASEIPEDNLYFRTIAKMPMPFAEYAGLLVKTATCNHSVCEALPSTHFYDNGVPKWIEAVGNVRDEVAFANFKVGGNLRIKGTVLNFNPRNEVTHAHNTTDENRADRLWWKRPVSNDFNYQLELRCELKNCLKYLFIRSDTPADVRHHLALTRETQVRYLSVNAELTLVKPGPGGGSEGAYGLTLCDEIDFSILTGSCKSTTFEVDPKDSWIKLPQGKLVSNVRYVHAHKSGEWGGITTSNNRRWEKDEQGRWIERKN